MQEFIKVFSMNDNVKRYADKDMFERIKQRPGMYIGEPCVNKLFLFLTGYRFALIKNNLDDLEGFFSDKPSFHDWVAMKESYAESTAGWAYIIDQATTTDKEGMELFFTYLDAYFARTATVLYEIKLSQKDIEALKYFEDLYWTAEKKDRWLNASIQIISYDTDKQGVFTRYLDAAGNHITFEALYASHDSAQKEIEYYFIHNKK